MKTFLFDEHLRLGAKMVDFAGFQMPLQYTSLIDEHHAVRMSVGLFDVSHMGLFEVQGDQVVEAIEAFSTNRITNHATYTIFCNDQGGCVDDLLVYKWDEKKVWLIGNASNREKDLNFLKTHLDPSFKITFLSDRYGILALQGPDSISHLSKHFPRVSTLKKNEFIQEKIVISATGYTGEAGFELVGTFDQLKPLFLKLTEEGVSPCGLGCRDTLRLEMGYALYGHELRDDISPLETVAAWTVKHEMKSTKNWRHMVGISLLEKGIPRQDYPVFKNNSRIGIVTSGTFSPSLQSGIALILVDEVLKIGDQVEVGIREKRVPAEVTTLPFYKRS